MAHTAPFFWSDMAFSSVMPEYATREMFRRFPLNGDTIRHNFETLALTNKKQSTTVINVVVLAPGEN